MSSSRRITRAFRLALAAVAVTVTAAPAVVAQSSTVASSAPTRMSIEDMTAQWASLERPLIGITELTDLQRDAIELMEEKYRKLFLKEAGPIRAARIALLQNSQNFARQDVERALDRMASLRKLQLQQLRGVLTDAQRVRYDENLKALAAEEEAARLQRIRDEAFYTP
ncbi:MAG: hypothetical protein U5K74_00395 [Gemmatimonadaceae bacterium]|nr:hypothetical protein [Gemmatimonadaceae bacterium]